MKKINPLFEGSELINRNVKSADPYGFLGNRDVLWVNLNAQELLELVYEEALISEDKYSEYINEKDRVISYEALDDILKLDELTEKRLLEKVMEKLKEECSEEINNFGGLRVLFNSGDEIIIKA